MRFWFKRRRRHRREGRRFAELKAMAPEQRRAALASVAGEGWIEAAANYGLVEAQVLWGQALLKTDPALAVRWFAGAAAAGYAPATNMLGRCLEKGWGTRPDAAGAAMHYRIAAEQGLDWAQYNLASLLLHGLGTAKDRIEAYAWFDRAASQGHAKAANMLGRFHEEGWDRAADPATAVAYYRRAAEGGDYRGQFNLATVLTQMGKDDEALVWFEAALSSGDADFLREARRVLGQSPDRAHQALLRRNLAATAPVRGTDPVLATSNAREAR